MKHEHVFTLMDGIVINGTRCDQVSIRPIDGSLYERVEQLVEKQLIHLQKQPDFRLVNESHRQGLKGYMLLNECAAAAISHIGNIEVQMEYYDYCQLKVSAQDWTIILTANLAVSEYYGDTSASTMSA